MILPGAVHCMDQIRGRVNSSSERRRCAIVFSFIGQIEYERVRHAIVFGRAFCGYGCHFRGWPPNFTGWPKKKFGTFFFVYALTVSNINRFTKLFYCQNENICKYIALPASLPSGLNNTITKNSTSSVSLHYLVKCHFRCGRMFSDCFTAYCLLILTVKQFRKSVNI